MNRGFEVVSRYQNAGLTLPQRATQHAAGYVIERVWVKDDQSLKIKLIQDFIQHFKSADLQIIPLWPEALEFFNHHPEFNSYLAKPLHSI